MPVIQVGPAISSSAVNYQEHTQHDQHPVEDAPARYSKITKQREANGKKCQPRSNHGQEHSSSGQFGSLQGETGPRHSSYGAFSRQIISLLRQISPALGQSITPFRKFVSELGQVGSGAGKACALPGQLRAVQRQQRVLA